LLENSKDSCLDPTGLGLGVPGLSVLIDRKFLRSENEPDRDLMELMGMERLVGLRNMAGEAIVEDRMYLEC